MTCPQCGLSDPEFRRDGEVAGFHCECGLAFTRGDLGGLSDEEVKEEMEGLWMGNVENLPLRRRLNMAKTFAKEAPLVDHLFPDGQIPINPLLRGIKADVTVHPKNEDNHA